MSRVMRRLRWTVDVPGWRYTRRWIIGVRHGEWWIGARHNFACDWWEIGLLGLTVCVPCEGKPRRRRLPANVWRVPAGADRCPRCRDQNYESGTRICITCTWGDSGYADGRFANGWPGLRAEAEGRTR